MNLELCEKDKVLSRNWSSVSTKERVNYKNVVCVKPWGYEFLAFESDRIGIWCLTIRKNHGTSLHCHFHKDTTMVVLSGCAKLTLIDKVIDLPVMSRVHIPKQKFHAISSFSDETVILEIEVFDRSTTFSDKNDLLRINDQQYSRDPTGYSTSVKLDYDIQKYGYFWLDDDTSFTIHGCTVNVNKHGPGMILKGNICSNGQYLCEGSFTDVKTCDECTYLSFSKPYSQEDAKIIYSLEHLKVLKQRLCGKIVLTSGCFDIIHVGHIHNLKQSKLMGDTLVVCLSNDDQIRKLKGETRPINTYEDRINLFKTISYVDYIILYDEENIEKETTLDKIMKILDPYFWIKGSDYTVEEIMEKHPSLQNIKIIENVPNKSTTNIVNSIKNSL